MALRFIRLLCIASQGIASHAPTSMVHLPTYPSFILSVRKGKGETVYGSTMLQRR